MNNLKQIKKSIKEQGLLKSYNKKFKHKDMKFLLSYVALTFNEEIKIDLLVKEEVKLLNVEKGPKMFINAYSSLSKMTDKNIDWNSFGKFIWYIYQSSTYWKEDKKKNNIYSKESFVAMNDQKRKHYNKWMRSIPETTEGYNLKIMEVMKRVF